MKNKSKKIKMLKKQVQGITLIALVVTIIVLLILAGVSIAMLVGENGIITQAQRAARETEEAQRDEEAGLSSLETAIQEALGNVYNEEKGVNAPRLTAGMTPIKFTDPSSTEKGTVVETTSEDTEWYNYEQKKWANAQTEDGSMWVWIPRFAYRVNSSTQNFDVVFLIGTTDTYYDESGNIQTAKRCTSEDELVDTSTGYTVHPAFTDETAINYRNGGWDKEITGIWVAKFEAGYASGNNDAPVKASSVHYTQDRSVVHSIEANGNTTGGNKSLMARNWLDGIYGNTITAIKYPVFQPLTYSMNYINVNDAFNVAKSLTENGNIYGFNAEVDSHLIKNSEWGAVTYLSKSKYGLNTVDIIANNVSLNSGNRQRTATEGKIEVDSVYAVTGCTTGINEEEKQTNIDNINTTTGNVANDGVYTWNQLNGTKASSTGTIYGIYDMSGGLWGRTASYIANNASQLKTYGETLTYYNNELRTNSTKYTIVYPHDSNNDTAYNNWIANSKIYGDGIRETSTQGEGANSWYDDTSVFPRLEGPFSIRGDFTGAKNTGIFAFYCNSGGSDYATGFRTAVII